MRCFASTHRSLRCVAELKFETNTRPLSLPSQDHRRLGCDQAQRRRRSGGGGGGGGDVGVKAPSPVTTSWHRTATLVKKTTEDNRYLEHIRDLHDPSQHVKTLEDEIKGTMGKALGKQGEKLVRAIRAAESERRRHDDLTSSSSSSVDEIRECATRHNALREAAVKARWELMVHRQAVGFVVNNHKIVHEKFPVGDALPVDDERSPSRGDDANGDARASSSKQFGTQLDWWQRIGRWM